MRHWVPWQARRFDIRPLAPKSSRKPIADGGARCEPVWNSEPIFSYMLYSVCMHAKLPQLCLTLCYPMDLALQAPLSMGFSSQEYWTGLPFPPAGDLPDPGIKSGLVHCRQILYHLTHQGSPDNALLLLLLLSRFSRV